MASDRAVEDYGPEGIVLAGEAAEVLRAFYDDVTPCVHRLRAGERCAICGRARALLIECDAVVVRAEGT